MISVPILLINLDRSTERLAHAAAEFQRCALPFSRVLAVDGQVLTPAEIANAYDPIGNRRSFFAPLQRGEIACFLSHRKAWAEIVATGAPFGVVFEDDAVLLARLGEALAAIQARPVDWDVIKLYSYATRTCEVVAGLAGGIDLVRHWVASLSTAAYCVSRSGCEKLIAGLLPIKRPLDVEFQHWWEHQLNLLAVEPCVASVAQNIGGSTIGLHRRHGVADRILRELRRPLFRADLAWRSIHQTRRLQ